MAGAEIQALDSKPALSEFLFEYWEAFFALSRARSAGFSANPISLSDIAAYLAIMSVCDAGERQEYLYFIQAMDQEFLNWVNAKSKKK